MSAQEYVLSCIDRSPLTEAVCDYSAWIAKKVGVPIKLIHTIEQESEPAVKNLSGAIGLGASEDLLNELTDVEQNHRSLLIKKGALMLEAAKDRVERAGANQVELIQQHGTLTEALVEREQDIRVLVMGIRGKNHDTGVGTQIENIVRALHKRILIVNKNFVKPKKIMLAYDGSDAAVKALDMVASSPLFKGIQCHLVYVENDDTQSETLLMLATDILEKAGLDVTTMKMQGQMEEILANYQVANDIDLMVMGAFGHNKIRKFLLGSFTAKMLEATQKPLLLLR